jgi:hypothetical protein
MTCDVVGCSGIVNLFLVSDRLEYDSCRSYVMMLPIIVWRAAMMESVQALSTAPDTLELDTVRAWSLWMTDVEESMEMLGMRPRSVPPQPACPGLDTNA